MQAYASIRKQFLLYTIIDNVISYTGHPANTLRLQGLPPARVGDGFSRPGQRLDALSAQFPMDGLSWLALLKKRGKEE